MKNYSNVVMILFLFVVAVSCEDESTDDLNSNNSELASIVEEYVYNNTTSAIVTYTIDNSLNTQIEYSYGIVQEQTFTNGQMTLMEVVDNGSIIQSQILVYDTAGRLISSSNQDSDSTSESSYDYVGNQILASVIEYDTNGDISNTRSYSFVLNDDNHIIQYQSGNSIASWNASYTNGNLTSFTASGYGDDVDGSATFTYSSELASEPYQKERYRFGTEWRNNIMLTQTGNYAFKQLAELGDNYLTGFSFIRDSDGEEIVSQTMTYEFDNTGRLFVQNRNKIFFDVAYGYIITYRYQ